MPAIQSAGMPLSLTSQWRTSAVMRGAVVAVEAPGLRRPMTRSQASK